MIESRNFIGSWFPKDHAQATRARIESLSAQLSNERYSDLGGALRSDFSRVSSASHELHLFEAKSANLGHAAVWGETIQSVLNQTRSDLQDVMEGVATSLSGSTDPDLSGLGVIGDAALSSMLSKLGTFVSGRAVFGNGSFESVPWPDAETVLSDLSAIAGNAPDVVTLISDVEAYFSPTGAFGSAIGAIPAAPVSFSVGNGTALEYSVSAGSPEIISGLRQAALASALPSAGFVASETDRAEINKALASGLLDSQAAISRLQGRVGVVQSRVETFSDEAERFRISQESTLANAVAPDPYEVAIRLQAEMSRLESTYAITARRSQLHLTTFIR